MCLPWVVVAPAPTEAATRVTIVRAPMGGGEHEPRAGAGERMKRALEPPRGTGPNDPPRGKKDDISLEVCLPRMFARARLRVTASKPSTGRFPGTTSTVVYVV